MFQAWTYGDVVLRILRPLDVRAVAGLESACQTHPWPFERVEAFLTLTHLRHEPFGLTASVQSHPVGYAILAVDGGDMSIERIGVLPEYRRRRIGTKLVARAMLEARVRKVAFTAAMLRESNIAAQKFYFECGFRAGGIAGPLRNWFGTEDAVAMRRPNVTANTSQP